MTAHTKTAELLFRLIEERFGSDAAFERAAGLPPKTVSNWRRGLSSSYMKMLPALARLFSVGVEDLLSDRSRENAVTKEELYVLLSEAELLPPEKRDRLYRLLKDALFLYLGH